MFDLRKTDAGVLGVLLAIVVSTTGCPCGPLDEGALTERDFAAAPWAWANHDQVIFLELESHQGEPLSESDTGEAGHDRFRVHFPDVEDHTFGLEYVEDESFSLRLYGPLGRLILCLDRDHPTETISLCEGTYTIELHHEGPTDETYSLFIRPGSTYVGRDCPGCDLSGKDLSNANLFCANLTDANLTNANLTDANLTDAFLLHANLSGADLTDAVLTGADLYRGTLSHANLTYANLTDADLTGANLTGANLTGANLTGANLTNANLSGANLTNAILTGAYLGGAAWVDGTTICATGSIGWCNH